MGDYSPSTSAEVYADDKAIAESGLGTAQKLAMAKKAGMDPMSTSQIKPEIAAATKSDQMKVTKWLQEHPDKDAAAAVVALGIVGATTVAAAAKAATLAKAAMGPKPPVTGEGNGFDLQGNPIKPTGSGTPSNNGSSTWDTMRGGKPESLESGEGLAQGNLGAEEANGQVPGEPGANPLDSGAPPSVPGVEKTVVPMFPGQSGYQGPSNSPGSKE